MSCERCVPAHPDADGIRTWLLTQDVCIEPARDIELPFLAENRDVAAIIAVYADDYAVRIALRPRIRGDARMRALARAHAMLSDPHEVAWNRGREGDQDDDSAVAVWMTAVVVASRPVAPCEVWEHDQAAGGDW